MSLIENSIQNFNNNEESKFLDKLKDYFTQEDIIKLSKSLSENNAIIAGGSVLSAFADFHMNDMDIYVNFSNVPYLYNTLIEIGYKDIHFKNISPAYDQSFLRKNNIMYHFNMVSDVIIENFEPHKYYDIPIKCNKCSKSIQGRINMKKHLYKIHQVKYLEYYNKPIIDLLIVPDGYDTKLVAQNFDLSFCEIWYDGVNTYAVDIDGIKNKRGILKPDYVNSLLINFNKFIFNRIKKYLKRGFDIKYEISEHFKNLTIDNIYYIGFNDFQKSIDHLTEGIMVETEGKKIYPEEFVVKKIFQKFLKKITNYPKPNFYITYKFLLKEFKISELFKIISLYYHICDPYMWHLTCFNDLNITTLLNIPIPIPPTSMEGEEFVRQQDEYMRQRDEYMRQQEEFATEQQDRLVVNIGTFQINQEDRKNVDNPRTHEPIPEIKYLRINKKIKYIIYTYFLEFEYLQSYFLEYFNKIINFDIEDIDSPYYISTNLKINRPSDVLDVDDHDPKNSIGYENSINNELLSKIIFNNNIYYANFYTLSDFYSKLNYRNEFYLKTGNIPISSNMEINDVIMGYDRPILEFLEEDENNIIFIYITKNGDYKG